MHLFFVHKEFHKDSPKMGYRLKIKGNIKTMQNQSEPVPSFDEFGQQTWAWAMYLDNFWTEPSRAKQSQDK